MSQSYKSSSRENPSFSSTLLDAIYRSIESENHEEFSSGGKPNHGREILRRETWSEKEVRSTTTTHHGKVFLRRKSMEHVQDNYGDNGKKESNFMFLKNSSWSSSDSSFSGGLSSSETEFLEHVGKKQSSNYSMPRPKPIRTTTLSFHHQQESRSLDHHRGERNGFTFNTVSEQVKNRSGTNKLDSKDEADNFVKMKLRALKIYGDLKKVKQPISPGGRFASFVNSLFTANGNNKKEKKSAHYYNNEDERRKSKSTNGSTCSSASSFSRSCLSKTPSSSSSTKDHHQVKRSVRFCPVNVILDDDQHCGAKEKPLYQQQSDCSLKSKKADYSANHNKGFKFVVRDDSFMIKNDIRELLKKYHQKSSGDYMNGVISDDENRDEDEEDDDEDAVSCASSDLFELDSLAACNNGLGRYTEELPVYETTYLDTNRLSSGLMV